MFSEYLNNTVVGVGFLNLFLNLFILTVVTGALLIVSRKWMSSARSFLLLGMIISYVLIIGLNLALFERPNSRFAMISLPLPSIDAGLLQQPMLSDKKIALDHSSEKMTLLQENRKSFKTDSLETTRKNNLASLSRLIMSVASIAGVI